MAGGLTISTLNDSSGVLATQNGMSGIAKAWVNFNGLSGSVAIRTSFNFSSVTRNGAGDYSVAFTTAMPDADYTIVGTAGLTEGNFHGIVNPNTDLNGTDIAPTTTGFRFITSNNVSGTADNRYVYLSIFR